MGILPLSQCMTMLRMEVGTLYNKKICALRKKGHEITERTIFTPFKIAYTAITTGSRRLGFNCEDVVM